MDSPIAFSAMSQRAVLFNIAQGLSERLPSRGALWLSDRLADCRWRTAGGDRRVVCANLTRLLGHPIPEFAQPVREVFRNFGWYLAEFFSAHQHPVPHVEVEGYEQFLRAYQAKQGVIILTAHLGNWELGAITIHRFGIPVSAVALPHTDAKVDELFNRQRRRCGIDVIPLGSGAARESVSRLRQGHVLGILGDREFGANGLSLPFCGGFATLPKGPAVLSLRTHAAVIPSFFLREAPWRFRLCFEPPILPPGKDASDWLTIEELTRRYTAVLERYVKCYPTQWLMFAPLDGSSKPLSPADPVGTTVRSRTRTRIPAADELGASLRGLS